jgi:dienelactone hydrolase
MTNVVIPGVDGDLIGVLLRPATGAATTATAATTDTTAATATATPAVIVLPEIDGFCAGTIAAARRLAAAGYVALALDLYAPYGSTPILRSTEDTLAWIARLSDRRQLSDLAMALSWLRDLPGVDADRTAVVGFSIGGRYGMLMSTEPHGLRAVVALYSRPWPGGAIANVALAPGEHVARFGTPVCAIFGADDELIPLDMVDEFGRLLARYPLRGHEVHTLPGRHFFANESRPRRYLPDSAEAAWAITLRFLASRMAQPPSSPQTAGVAPSAR